MNNLSTYEKSFIKPGDQFCIEIIGIRNNSSKASGDVEVSVPVPPGLELLSYTIPKGYYNEDTKIWRIGKLYPGEILEGENTPQFCYKVLEYTDSEGAALDIEEHEGFLSDVYTGDCFVPFRWDVEIYSLDECVDCNPTDNTYCITVTGVSCCEVKNCIESSTINCELLTY